MPCLILVQTRAPLDTRDTGHGRPDLNSPALPPGFSVRICHAAAVTNEPLEARAGSPPQARYLSHESPAATS